MRMRHAAVMAGLALGLMSGTAQADTLEYNVLIPFSGPNGSVTGTIDTDYKAGVLRTSDIVAFDLFYDGMEFSSADSQALVIGNSLFASGNQIGFNFDNVSGSDVSFGNATINLQFYAGSAALGAPFYQITTLQGFDEESVTAGTTLEIGVSEGTVMSSVPRPASAPQFGAALLALGAVGYGLKRKGKAAA